ncbi:MAG: DUF922 domain-containing protein [Flavobacteriaceae bacterium]|nr:DUF922 domain-containing protein [Flavobacteriaceae bacterium]
MKIILFLFLISSLPINDAVQIQWREHRQLTWRDFKGKPDAGDSFVASTNSGMSFSFSYKVTGGKMTMDYEVECNFYPELSWYKPDLVTDYILKHEQTHFDISELYTRKLRKAMEETSFSNDPKEEVNKLYQKLESARQQLQIKYDFETDHSKNEPVEIQWRRFVAKELKKYERWKSE